MDEAYQLVKTTGALSVQGPHLEGEWGLKAIDDNNLLLTNKESSSNAYASVSHGQIEMFSQFLSGLISTRFDGVVEIGVDGGYKRLFFRSGELVFASSSIIDDRLGEVIYRNGHITLERMTEFAVQVNRTTKFGKALLLSGMFTSLDLWDALKAQTLEIFRSIFLFSELSWKVDSERKKPSTSVSFEESTEKLRHRFDGFGRAFRDFRNYIHNESRIEVRGDAVKAIEAKPGTFASDTLELFGRTGTVGQYVSQSKLLPINSLLVLFESVNRRTVEVENIGAIPPLKVQPSVSRLKNKMETFHLIVDSSKKAFEAESTEFPAADLHRFAGNLFSTFTLPIRLTERCFLSQKTIRRLFIFCGDDDARSTMVEKQLESITQFLLQLTGDLLPQGRGWKVKEQFQNLFYAK